jgi:signal transduction histidine kinase
VNYSTENGLSSNMVWTITEDDFGRIYLGTEKGLNQFDPSTGRIRLFTTADGLAGDAVYHCMKDRRGTIWVGTINGLSRLTPRAERVSVSPPRIYFSRIQVADQTLSLPERGAEHLPEMTLPAAQNNLRIEYVGLSFRGERVLTYQYKLDGVDDDWNPPRDERSVNYARLSPGSYRFLVRAIHQEGAMSLEPAVFEFRIRPPIWQRWWFVTAAALFLMSIGYAINRYRLAKLLEVERVRTRIAGDLHDDIGASLSEIAVLSEVVRQRTSAAQPEARQLLEAIADKARGLVDTMSDIVWSIDPRRDDLDNVIFRVSDLASDLLEAKGIAFTLDLPPEPEKIRLTPDERRHLYLIFKEAFNNIVRHAQCSRASVKLRIADRRLVAEIADNGCGLPEGYRREEGRPSRGGYGLENMQTRAAEMGGEVQIDSTPGEGMRVIVSVPLRSLI